MTDENNERPERPEELVVNPIADPNAPMVPREVGEHLMQLQGDVVLARRLALAAQCHDQHSMNQAHAEICEAERWREIAFAILADYMSLANEVFKARTDQFLEWKLKEQIDRNTSFGN